MTITVTIAILLVVTFLAAAIDVRTRTIPNALLAPAALAVIAVHAPEGLSVVGLCTATMLVAFIAGTLAFSAGWLGGGDVKLIAVCCGLVGAAGAARLVPDILIAGALLALVSAAARGRLLALVRSAAAVAAFRTAPDRRNALPYAVAIAAGSAAYAISVFTAALRFPT
jgi:prepilin peptidase CpaA